MKNPKNKGTAFEREICKKLSLWWTQALPVPRSDVFWRTAISGGRATVRKKKGESTFNSYGDVCAVDPIGLPFLKQFTVEIKRGYSQYTPFDLFDRRKGHGKHVWEQWIKKAEEDAEAAGSNGYMIIAQRNGRKPVVVFDNDFTESMLNHLSSVSFDFGKMRMDLLSVFLFDDFLGYALPKLISKDAPR